MTPENFCYWLRGFIELSEEGVTLTPRQVQIINDHLNLVMKKVTPQQPSTTSVSSLLVDHGIRPIMSC